MAWVKDLVGGRRRPGSGVAVISTAGQGPRERDGEARGQKQREWVVHRPLM